MEQISLIIKDSDALLERLQTPTSSSELSLVFELKEYSIALIGKLHFSILGGEHYYKSLSEKLKRVTTTLNQIEEKAKEIAEKNKNENDYIDYIDKTNLFKCLHDGLVFYKNLHDIVQSKLGHFGRVDTFYLEEGFGRSFALTYIEEIVKNIEKLHKEIEELERTEREIPIEIAKLNEELKKEEVNKEELQRQIDALNQKLSDASQRKAIAEWQIIVDLLKVNIYLAEFDFNFQCSKDFLKALAKIKILLDKIEAGVGTIEKIIISKCNYLLKKVLIRRDKKAIIDNSQFVEKEIKLSDIEKKIQNFIEFNNSTDKRYGKNNSIFNKDSEYSKACNKQIFDSNAFRYLEAHFLSKYYYKNQLKGDEALKNIDALIAKIEFIGKHEVIDDLEKFEKIAWESLIILLEKNKLKIICNDLYFLLTETELTEHSLKEKITAIITQVNLIESKQSKYAYEDYYHFKIAVRCLIKVIDKILALKKSIELSNEFAKINETLTDFIRKYIEKFHTADRNNILPLYLPFKECLLTENIDGSDRLLFLDSSYLLPVNFAKEKKELEAILREYDTLKLQFGFELNQYYSNLKKQNKELNDEFRNEVRVDVDKASHEHTMRGVQVLGIFAGVIAFAFGSINTIPRFKCNEGIFLFLITLGAIMAGFVWVINYIIIANEDRQPNAITVQSSTGVSIPFRKRLVMHLKKRSNMSGIIILLILIVCAVLSFTLPDCLIESDGGKEGLHNSINIQPENKNSNVNNCDNCDTIIKIKEIPRPYKPCPKCPPTPVKNIDTSSRK